MTNESLQTLRNLSWRKMRKQWNNVTNEPSNLNSLWLLNTLRFDSAHILDPIDIWLYTGVKILTDKSEYTVIMGHINVLVRWTVPLVHHLKSNGRWMSCTSTSWVLFVTWDNCKLSFYKRSNHIALQGTISEHREAIYDFNKLICLEKENLFLLATRMFIMVFGQIITHSRGRNH